MKFLIAIVLTALLSVTACLYFPWWSIAPAAFIVAVAINQKPGLSFLAGFTALLLLWGGLSWYISDNNQDILAHKMSLLLIKSDNPLMLVLITAFIGAIVGGFAALSGSYLRRK